MSVRRKTSVTVAESATKLRKRAARAAPQPLDGVRVIDFTAALFGGLTGQLLGDFGADVIKVEPLSGDYFRLTNRRPRGYGDSVRWMGVNRSKRSIGINLKNPRGTELALQLIKGADVVLHNFRPGVMDRLGLSEEKVRPINPKLIYCSLYGYGESGPFSRRMAADYWVQGFAGIVAFQGTKNGPPYISGTPFLDQGAPLAAAYGIALALLARQKYGIGQELTTNLVDVAIFLQSSHLGDYLIDGRLITKGGRGWGGYFPMGVYSAKDGDVIFWCDGDAEWPLACKILNAEKLCTNPRYKTQEDRENLREELYPLLDDAFRKKTREEWRNLFQQHKLRCDPCLTYAELFEHPQVTENNVLLEMDHPVEGNIKLVRAPVKLKKTPSRPSLPPPVLSQHTKQILRQMGYKEDQILDLYQKGVVGLPDWPEGVRGKEG